MNILINHLLNKISLKIQLEVGVLGFWGAIRKLNEEHCA